MKIYLFVALGFLFLPRISNAQQLHVGDAHFGIKGGLNLYNIHNDNGANYDTRTSFNLGLLAHIHLNKQWALQPELVYSGQGAKYTTAGDETTLKLGYINLPVMLQYMFDNGFRLEAGPQVGFLTGAKAVTGKTSVDVKDNLTTADFGLGFGVGYLNPPTGFGVDARYNLGLTDINKNSTVTSMNRGFQLGVFYQFMHTKK